MEEINTKWLENLAKQIEAIPDCRALNKLIAYLKEQFEQLIEDILDQIAQLVGLIIPPTSLKKIIKYLKNLVKQYLGPYLAAIRQLAKLIKAFAAVLKAVQEKLANLHCSISPAQIIGQLKTSLRSAAYRRIYDGPPTLALLADIATKLKGGVPPLEIIASRFGVNVNGLPAIAAQYGGTLPFMEKMLDTYQPAVVPEAPTMPTIIIPTDIPLDNEAPTIDSLSTNAGYTDGGTLLVITGTGFLDGVIVTIGDIECDNIELIDETSVQCTTPALPTGFPYSVVVTNTDGQSATLANAFNIINP